MPRALAALLTAAALLLAAAAVFLVPTLFGKPWKIEHLYARVFLETILVRPMLLSQLRILEPWGLDFHSDDLGDFSPEFEREQARKAHEWLGTLRSLRSVREIPKFSMRTLTCHEAIPGHHLQIALAMEQDELPFFRRVVPFTAFVEGWAHYAERLAAEQGFHPTPLDRLGGLVAEAFRAVRLVVDTGIHAKRWTREEAIAYMLENTGMPRTDVVAEVERYIVYPGQACAYKAGQLEILRLRRDAREALGPAFDLRAFHDVVLGQGAMPLVILEEVVRDWIRAQGQGADPPPAADAAAGRGAGGSPGSSRTRSGPSAPASASRSVHSAAGQTAAGV